MFPVRCVNELSGALFLLFDDNLKLKKYWRRPSPPMKLLRPGMAPQFDEEKGFLKEVLFLGGNKERQCYFYNPFFNTWKDAGTLPDKHLIT
mmetsp:Transcript_16889/g.25981  ORF Transcript_16889/g.25981 Transcript_16889/m.25981 type:complete len:91 (+) Transcript_16889:465-737(+)